MIQKSSKKAHFFLQEARLAGKLAEKDQTGFSSPLGSTKQAHMNQCQYIYFLWSAISGWANCASYHSVCELYDVHNNEQKEIRGFPKCCQNIHLRTFCSELHRPEAHKHGLLILKLTRKTPITRMSSGFRERSSCQTVNQDELQDPYCSTTANMCLNVHRSDPKAVKEDYNIVTPWTSVCPECEVNWLLSKNNSCSKHSKRTILPFSPWGKDLAQVLTGTAQWNVFAKRLK